MTARKWLPTLALAIAIEGIFTAVAGAEPKKPACSVVAGGCSAVTDEAVESFVRSPGDVDGFLGFARTNPARRCTYSDVPDSFDQRVHVHKTADIPARAVYFVRNCGGQDVIRWYVPSSSATNDENVLALIGEAFGAIRPPAPRVVTSPPLGSEVLTGMPMYLAVDDAAFSEQTGSVSAGQFTVTATVRPVSSWFSPGDQHDPRVCDGAGSVWSHGERPTEGDCTHTFTHTPAHLNGKGETFTLTSRVTYEASYTVEGPILAGTYDLGTFEGPETVVDIPVIERRAVRTSTNG